MQGRVFKTVAVIIPAYNASETIESTLKSALAQTRPPDEIVVADDGSRDNTAEIAERMGAKVLRLENGGAGRARNMAVAASSAEVLFFLDADDAWKPHKIQAHLDVYARGNPFPSFVIDLTQRVRPEGRYSGIAGVGRPGQIHWDEMIDSTNWTCGSSPSMPRDLFDAVGGFSESLRFAEDIEILMRVGHKFGPGYRIPEVGTFYNLRAGSLSRQPHDPEPIVREFLSRMPFLTHDQQDAIRKTICMTNALHAKPGMFFSELQPIGMSVLRDRRFYRYLALRALNAMGIRPL